MPIGLFTTKIGMTQLFISDGIRVPVTVLRVDENMVILKKTLTRDGYIALQIGYGNIRKKLINKPEMGHFIKNKVFPKKHLKEQKVTENDLSKYQIGSKIGIEILEGTLSVDATGISKGKGFAGVMKRHNFRGFRASHGTHESFRGGGSIGMCTKPGKVFKGKKMPGHMGNRQVTNQNLSIIKIMSKEKIICIKGSVPGGKNGIVLIKASCKK